VASTLDLHRNGAVGFIVWLDRFERQHDNEEAYQSPRDDPARDDIWRITRCWTALRKINHEAEG